MSTAKPMPNPVGLQAQLCVGIVGDRVACQPLQALAVCRPVRLTFLADESTGPTGRARLVAHGTWGSTQQEGGWAMDLKTYRIRVAGRTFVGAYVSGALAVILAQCFHGVHNASAIRVQA